ncbi:MAG TPA: copper chaperone [Methanoculleus sp.]|nr:copper chaperone [Methanoculleus sp.]
MTQEDETTILLPITGMACEGCVAAVKAALASVDGALSVQVSLEKKQAVVRYRPSEASMDDFRRAVEAAGYGTGV